MNAKLSNRRGRRSHADDATRRAEVDRERATRLFFGDDVPDADEMPDGDLADHASEAIPDTVTVRGIRAVEEL